MSEFKGTNMGVCCAMMSIDAVLTARSPGVCPTDIVVGRIGEAGNSRDRDTLEFSQKQETRFEIPSRIVGTVWSVFWRLARCSPRVPTQTSVLTGLSPIFPKPEFGVFDGRRFRSPMWGPHDLAGNGYAAAGSRLSFLFDLRGPCVVVDTACSGALVALNAAAGFVRQGDTHFALAAGVSLMLAPSQSPAPALQNAICENSTLGV